MKTKYIILSLIALIVCQTSQAQLLKKIKKRAEEAAKETIIRKVEEKAAEKTEKAMDTVLNADKKLKRKKRNKNTQNDNVEGKVTENEEVVQEEQSDTISPGGTIITSSNQRTPDVNPLMGSGKNAAKNLLDTYAFNWEFKTNMKITRKKKSKNTETVMNFFLNTNKDYYGMDIENEDMKNSGGKAIMIFDFKSEAMVMFANYGSQKMGMVNKLKDPTQKEVKDKDRNYTFKEIGSKTILGYECFGIEVENKDNKVKLFFTLDAPVNFSAFFAFSEKTAPKGFSDPQLFEILKEEALLMEMEMINKKNNETMKMIPISLEQKKTEFHKKDYQFMKMGF